MTLTFYVLRQFLSPFIFGTVLFLFVLLLERLFDLFDLIFNKGVQAITVAQLFALFIPTILPLALPMGVLLGCVIALGRMSEENEITAVRSAGISLTKALWIIPLAAFLMSAAMLPFNTHVAPWANRMFRKIYERIVHADPLLKIEAHKFFSIKNIKIYADAVDARNNRLRDLFVYQLASDGSPAERIFAKSGTIDSNNERFTLVMENGQLQRYDPIIPQNLVHTTFSRYEISLPLKMQEELSSTRFRSISTPELKKLIVDLKGRKLPTGPLESELALRYSIAFSPICLCMIGIPMAVILKKGGKTFALGITIGIIFAYYLLLILGLTLGEKGVLSPTPALWLANGVSLLLGGALFLRMGRQ